MPRPQRYPFKIEFWSNQAQLSGLETLCSDGLSDKATHLRQALQMYLRATGVAASPTHHVNGVNGKEQARVL
jgi:hypothetical protein